MWNSNWIRPRLPTDATSRYPLSIFAIPATETATPKKTVGLESFPWKKKTLHDSRPPPTLIVEPGHRVRRVLGPLLLVLVRRRVLREGADEGHALRARHLRPDHALVAGRVCFSSYDERGDCTLPKNTTSCSSGGCSPPVLQRQFWCNESMRGGGRTATPHAFHREDSTKTNRTSCTCPHGNFVFPLRSLRGQESLPEILVLYQNLKYYVLQQIPTFLQQILAANPYLKYSCCSCHFLALRSSSLTLSRPFTAFGNGCAMKSGWQLYSDRSVVMVWDKNCSRGREGSERAGVTFL